MKKTIKTGFALLLLLGSMHSFSQEEKPDELQTARIQLIEGTTRYNPAAALATFTQKANEGNGQAMNGLGLIYSRGIGVPANETLALEWFEKSAQAGYSKAYYNLALFYKEGVGVTKDLSKTLAYYEKAAKAGFREAWQRWGEMYKDGLGTPQDYPQAMRIFVEGAANGSAGCLYAQGYLHYKGFGTPQDYNKAISLFQQADDKGSSMGTYMLGYCYRNGYGVAMDDDKAKTLFQKAAKLGLNRATNELTLNEAENATPNQLQTVSTPLPEDVENAPIVVPKKLPKVKQKITKEDISGTYTGTLLRYDWSGQNVLTTTPIEVTIDQESQNIKGIWVEQEGDSIHFNATINEKAIVFNDSKIDRVNRLENPILNSFKFKNAKLQIIENEQDVYIVGNLQLFNIKERENEKPMYLILEDHKEESLDPTIAIVTKLVVYPNPIPADSFKLSFDLAAQTPISIKIYDLMGLLKHQQQLTTSGTGLQEQMIGFNAPTGNYILNLYYNDQVVRTILIKK